MHRPSATVSDDQPDPELLQAQATRVLEAVTEFFDYCDSGPDGIKLAEAKDFTTYNQLVFLERIWNGLTDLFAHLPVKFLCKIYEILRDIDRYSFMKEGELPYFIKSQAF